MNDQAAAFALKVDWAYRLLERGEWDRVKVMLCVSEMAENLHRMGPLRSIIEAYDNDDENSLALAIGEARKLIDK